MGWGVYKECSGTSPARERGEVGASTEDGRALPPRGKGEQEATRPP